MPGPFALDYFVFVLVASLGVLQAIAAYSGLRGLLLISSGPLAFLLGLGTASLAFIWFFASEPRNLPDTQGGLDGNQSAGLFAVAAGLALLLTLLVSSLSNRTLGERGQPVDPGLDALRQTTYLKAISLKALPGKLRKIWMR